MDESAKGGNGSMAEHAGDVTQLLKRVSGATGKPMMK